VAVVLTAGLGEGAGVVEAAAGAEVPLLVVVVLDELGLAATVSWFDPSFDKSLLWLPVGPAGFVFGGAKELNNQIMATAKTTTVINMAAITV
jgi:hypothetical protein